MNLDSVPDHAKAGLIAMNANKALANVQPDEVLDILRTGQSVSQVAKSYGISHQALYEWLLRHCPDQWVAISSARSLVKIEQAEELVDDENSDGLAITRAREKARMAFWQLERTARKMYGQKDESANGVNIQVVIAPMDAEPGVTIEHDADQLQTK